MGGGGLWDEVSTSYVGGLCLSFIFVNSNCLLN
jgi:hypothetical protein